MNNAPGAVGGRGGEVHRWRFSVVAATLRWVRVLEPFWGQALTPRELRRFGPLFWVSAHSNRTDMSRRRRTYKRDRIGRFARNAGTKVATNRLRYVEGSFVKNLEVGHGGDYKGVKAGAEFRTQAGRGVLVKGIVGVHGKPDRRIDVTPSLSKQARELSVTARPNPNRATARNARKAAAGSKVATTPNRRRKTASPSSAAGKRVRR